MEESNVILINLKIIRQEVSFLNMRCTKNMYGGSENDLDVTWSADMV